MEKRNEEIFIREEDGGSQKRGAGRSPCPSTSLLHLQHLGSCLAWVQCSERIF